MKPKELVDFYEKQGHIVELYIKKREVLVYVNDAGRPGAIHAYIDYSRNLVRTRSKQAASELILMGFNVRYHKPKG